MYNNDLQGERLTTQNELAYALRGTTHQYQSRSLLALYRQQDAWHIESEQVYVDVIEKLVMNNRFYSQHKAIEVDVELPEDIYFLAIDDYAGSE